MNLQSLVVLVLRMIALIFALQVPMYLFPFTLQALPLFKDAPAFAAVPWIMLVAFSVAPVWLWVCAVPFAGLVTRRLPQEVSVGTVSLADCYSVAFLGVGLFYLVGHFAQVLTWAHYLLKLAIPRPGIPSAEPANWYAVVQVFVPFVVGILLCVKARLWASTLAARHTPGNPSEKSPNGDAAGPAVPDNRPARSP